MQVLDCDVQSSTSLTKPVLFYVLLAYTLLLVIPVSFQATTPSLDSAWGYDLNYFLHSRFRFGPDLIFTYGPLGFLNNPQHVGNDIAVAMGVHAVFWIALGVQLSSIWRSGKPTVAVAFCLSLVLGHHLYYDYFDYSLIALSLITIVKLIRSSPTYFDLLLVPALTAVTFLLKFSAFSMVVLLLAVYTIHLALNKSLSIRRSLWIVLCLAMGPLAYLLYDFSFSHLFQYIKGALQIASGFATAMSLESDHTALSLAAGVCLLLLINTALGLRSRRLFMSEAMLIILVTWNAFRLGFVRGDTSHTPVFFGFSILIVACLYARFESALKPDLPTAVLVISSFVLLTIALQGFSLRYPVFVAANWWPTQSLNELKQFANWNQLNYSLDHAGDSLFAPLPGVAFRTALQHKRVMVFPNGTPYVAEQDFEMFPIYALQNYAAYTAYLDNKGANNLMNAQPPVEKVIVEWVSVDERNQFIDTPAMSLALLSGFKLESQRPDALLLNQRAVRLPLHLITIDQLPFRADEWVAVPRRNQLVAMSIRLKQNLAGKLVTNLYAQAPVYMDCQTQSGSVIHVRVPPQNLGTPGIINFIPESINDLAMLWKPEPIAHRITRIRLSGPGLRWTTSKGYTFYLVNGTGITLQK